MNRRQLPPCAFGIPLPNSVAGWLPCGIPSGYVCADGQPYCRKHSTHPYSWGDPRPFWCGPRMRIVPSPQVETP